MRNLFIIITFSLLSFNLLANGLSENSDGTYTLTGKKINILKLVKQYGELEKVNVFISSDINQRKSFDTTFLGNKTIQKKDLSRFIISLVSSKNLAVVRSKDAKELSVVSSNNARMENLPLYSEVKDVPQTKEFISFFYTLKYRSPKQVERTLRSFSSRAGTVTSDINSKGIILRDYAIHIHFLSQLIKEVDRPSILKIIDDQTELNKELKELAKARPPIEETIEKHLFIFIALFSLISLIIGFMVRGFVIRRIEGGL